MKSDKSYEPGSGRITEGGKMKSSAPAAKPMRSSESMSSKPPAKPFPGAAKPFTAKDGGKARGR